MKKKAKKSFSDNLRVNFQLIEEFRSLPAAFGPQLPSEGLFVLALRALPSHACSPVHDRSYVDEDLIKEYNGTAPSITKVAVLVRRWFQIIF